MRLTDLEAELVVLTSPDGSMQRGVATVAEAQGVMFLCPKCFEAHGERAGTHYVLCWFVGVPPHVEPKPGRWTPSGTDLHDLTLNPPPNSGYRSVLLTSGCRWHGHITNGEVTNA